MAEWETCLSEAGYRITVSRRAVIEVLIGDSAPLSPQEILEQARAVHARLGLVTVYRTLNLLTDLDLVRRIHRDDGCHGYVLASPGHHHAVICHNCGRAVEFTGKNDIDALIAQVERRTGYQVDGHLLQLSGLCPNCQRT